LGPVVVWEVGQEEAGGLVVVAAAAWAVVVEAG
jgi:hypothetical protein